MVSRWLITGATGLLASYLVEACTAVGRVTTTARSGGDLRCDLGCPQSVRDLVSAAAPDVVVHAAGLTDVERCEREPAEALAANRDAAANLVAALPGASRFVFISTDQVYPDSAGPHREDETGPVNMYGKSKLQGEQAALSHPRSLVLRTNFFGPSRQPGRRSLSDFFTETLSRGEPVTLFEDVLFSPLHMSSLAALVTEIVNRGLAGVFNLGCRKGASKAAFALALARHLGLSAGRATIGSSTAVPARAPRPRDLRLDVSRIEAALGRAMPTLDEEIAKL